MKSNWHHQNFWAKGQGQTTKISDFDPDLPAHKISRTLQFSQNIKLINPNNQHNKQTNLIEHYQFWTDWVEFTSSNFHGQTLSSTFQNFHSSPRLPRPQKSRTLQISQNIKLIKLINPHNKHTLLIKYNPSHFKTTTTTFHAQTTSSTQKILTTSPTHSAQKFIKNQNVTTHQNNSQPIQNIQIYHSRPILNSTTPTQLTQIFTAKHSRSNFRNFQLFDLDPPPKKFTPKISTPKNFLQSLYQFHTMYTTPSSFIPSTFQMQIASPLFKTRPSNLPFSQFAICPIHHTKTLLSHSSFLISSQIQCQSIHQTHHFQFTHFQSHFKTFTTQTTFTNTSKHPFSNIKLLLKIDMKILVLESVWELRSHSLHWLSSKPIMHFPIWIFKKSSLHSEKFGRTSFSQHSQKFTHSHPSSRKLLLTSLTLRHSHGKPHSLTPQASTLSHSPAFHPIHTLLHAHPPSNMSPTPTFTNGRLHSKMNKESPVLLRAWEFHPPFLHRLSSYWTLPNAPSILHPFLFPEEKSLQTSPVFALQIAPFFTHFSRPPLQPPPTPPRTRLSPRSFRSVCSMQCVFHPYPGILAGGVGCGAVALPAWPFSWPQP